MKKESVLQTGPARRESSLELYRIVLMFLIVAHHYVINSSAWTVLNADPLAPKSLFLLEFAAWGKTGINCFMMITGYFMCKSNITVKKYAKLLFTYWFYTISIYFIFVLTGYEAFTVKGLLKAIWPVQQIAGNFFGTYLVFFLFIPFLNILIHNINEKQHILLMLLTLFMYTVLGTMPGIYVVMNYVSWYIVIYFIASYIRLYPKKWFDSAKLWGWLTLGSVAASVLSVLAGAWVGVKLDRVMFDYFLSDCNKILAVTNAVTSFLFFKNLRMPYSPFINSFAACTLGVLLIHANSDTMRIWLWEDVVRAGAMYESDWMIPYAIASVAAIQILCTAIEYLRLRFVEKPVLSVLDRKLKAWQRKEIQQ